MCELQIQDLKSSLKIDMMETNTVVVSEKYGETGPTVKYVRKQGADKLTVLRYRNTLTSLSQLFVAIFLPQGYPYSVSEDYLVYQLWDTLQAFASSITGTLATQAVLKGVGVGDENASPLAATMTWIMKEGTGMLGRIAFAWSRGSDLDCHCKQWRLFADVLNDVAIFLELAGQFFGPNVFIFLICSAGVLKSIVGVAGGATRAALIQHQALKDNLADVSAKDGSQETLVNLAALVCSLILMPVVGQHQMFIWTLFGIFTALHLYANYMAISSVVMSTLNQTRLFTLVQHYITSGGGVLSRQIVNQQEPVFWPKSYSMEISLGCSLSKTVNSFSSLSMLSKLYQDSKYILTINTSKHEVCVVFRNDAVTFDYLKACFEAMVLCICYNNTFKGISGLTFKQLEEICAEMEQRRSDFKNIIELCHEFTNKEFPNFIEGIKKHGWKTEQSQLGQDQWKANWNVFGLNTDQLSEMSD